MEDKLSELAGIILKSHNINISLYDNSFVERAIQKRSSSLDLNTDLYITYLKKNKSEAIFFYESLNINYSVFFRNPLNFVLIEKIILPQLIEKKKAKNEKEIRIWSAACAEGQEAYSIAIIFDELQKSINTPVRCRIFASDCMPDIINKAKEGIFQSASLGNVTLNRINVYFKQNENNYNIDSCIKDYIDFSVFDLLTNQRICPPASIFGNFDIIFCSNILFYYNPESRRLILEKIGNCLSDDGFVITGEVEAEILKSNNYQKYFNNSTIFQAK